MKVLVTGGTGFVGSHLVEALVGVGHDVRCLVRNPTCLRWLAGSRAEIVEGDCTVPDSLPRAVAGVERVFHLAGATWAASAAEFHRHNADATRNLLVAAAAAAVARFLLVSSQAAAGPAMTARPVSETDPARPITPYGDSKLAAERHAFRYRDRLAVTIVRPSAVYGPRDRAFLPYFRLVRRGFLVEFGPGERTVSLCHVSDLVRGLIQAADSQSASGSVYFVADSEPYPWRRVESEICAALGVDAKRVVVPEWLLRSGGALGQAYSAITRRGVLLNRARVAEIVAKRWACDTSRARRELGFTPNMTLHDGLRQAVRWYEQQQWI